MCTLGKDGVVRVPLSIKGVWCLLAHREKKGKAALFREKKKLIRNVLAALQKEGLS